MVDLDIARFWKDDEIAHGDNCFAKEAPQVALGIRMSDECVFAELQEEGHPWDVTPLPRRIELNKRYNDKAEKIVGKRLLRESFLPEDAAFPATRRIGEVFGGRYVWANHSEWLESDIRTPQALAAQLDAVDKLDLRAFLLPANWAAEKKRIFETYGVKPSRARGIRGPVTLACSIYGAEDFLFLLLDEPELCARFSRSIADVAIGIAEVFDEEAGYTKQNAPHGFSFADDNCCLLNPDMYRAFGLPVLQQVFARFSPDEGDSRYQHSDSAMGHLLPLLAETKLNGVNFGPTVLVDQIRRFMPRARIDGCIAPFTFMRNDAEQILLETKRDCAMAREHGRGLNLTTAGSINNGSSLESLRLIMAAVQTYGRY